MKAILLSVIPDAPITIARGESCELALMLSENDTGTMLTINLAGEGASLRLVGIFPCRERQQVDLRLHINHLAPDTSSRVLLKSVLADQAQVSLLSNVHIMKGAAGVRADLVQRSLLLSPEVKLKGEPAMEIEEDEVSARHAAAQGKPDVEQLFYLQSRGLGQEEAVELIVRGFIREVVQQVADADLREQVRRIIEQESLRLGK